MVSSTEHKAKLLISGEYLVLYGKRGLGIPTSNFKGSWVYKENIDDRLLNLIDYIKAQDISFIDIEAFEGEVKNGLFFDSNIPHGYGMGSSGALSAAILKEFGCIEHLDINHTLLYLRQIENYYHNKSSGIDALVSFYNKAVIINENECSFIDVANEALDKIYLFDSKIKRSTSKLVEVFVNKFKEKDLKKISELNDVLITSIISNKPYGQLWKQLSKIQLDLFDFCIPGQIKSLWKQSLEQDTLYFKLCGAGGGGYFLVYENKTEPDVPLIEAFDRSVNH